jgi:hypothetical protein
MRVACQNNQKRQVALFDCRDKVPRVKAKDCPREVRSRISNDREFGIIKD